MLVSNTGASVCRTRSMIRALRHGTRMAYFLSNCPSGLVGRASRWRSSDAAVLIVVFERNNGAGSRPAANCHPGESRDPWSIWHRLKLLDKVYLPPYVVLHNTNYAIFMAIGDCQVENMRCINVRPPKAGKLRLQPLSTQTVTAYPLCLNGASR